MQIPAGQKYEKWIHFSPGPVQSLAGWYSGIQLSMLRLDLLQSWTSGNKYYKLKYAIEFALANEVQTIVSKGGMFSNHLAALAEACTAFDLHLVSVIRSFAPDENNPGIRKLRENGSEIIYLNPEMYNAFDEKEAEHLFPGSMFIPEGGLNDYGIRGSSEILSERYENNPSHVIVSGGSMATACGIISSAPVDVNVIIVPAWKGCSDLYFYDILQQYSIAPVCSWQLWPDYHFGGFGRFDQQLLNFMVAFSASTGVPLDPVYTGKMMFAINDQWKSGFFKETDSILAIHTGGLQGLQGYQYRFPKEWGSYLAGEKGIEI